MGTPAATKAASTAVSETASKPDETPSDSDRWVEAPDGMGMVKYSALKALDAERRRAAEAAAAASLAEETAVAAAHAARKPKASVAAMTTEPAGSYEPRVKAVVDFVPRALPNGSYQFSLEWNLAVQLS